MIQEPMSVEPTPPNEPAQTGASVPAEPAMSMPPQPVTTAGAAARARGARLLNATLGLAVVLAIAGVAFAAGRFTAPAPATAGAFPNGPGQFFGNGSGNGNGNGNGKGGNSQGGPGGFLSGGPTIEGTVESVTDTTLTLKTASGQTIQIALDDTTTYHAQSDASASDVTAGKTVKVQVSGFRSGGPGASSAPGNGGGTGQTASDVTVVP